MECKQCHHFERRNVWKCPNCGKNLNGGIVFITGISGSDVEGYLQKVKHEAEKHGHPVCLYDIGEMMHKYAKDDDPEVRWDRILDADEKARRHLRALAFQELAFSLQMHTDILHLVDKHLTFRWRSHLTKGFEPHLLEEFKPYVRCYINLIEDLPKVRERLIPTAWGERETLELLLWRDEELFLTDLFAEVNGRVRSYAVAAAEPPSMVETLIWHPEIKKVYLSFPITNLKDFQAQEEIRTFRDKMRKFLVVFDPYASKDYDETYKRPEMAVLRKQVGETTEERDYRFIDQADAIVVYYPQKVASKGVDAEMNHARRTGKPIFLYSPEDPGGGPFAVSPNHFRSNPEDFIALLEQELKPSQ